MSKSRSTPRAPRPKDGGKRPGKKKPSILVQEKVEYIDYKDVNLLQRFVSDRSKIRSRRVTSNTTQQQREIATAVKNAREMALMPYTKRVSTQRATRPPRATARAAVTAVRAAALRRRSTPSRRTRSKRPRSRSAPSTTRRAER